MTNKTWEQVMADMMELITSESSLDTPEHDPAIAELSFQVQQLTHRVEALETLLARLLEVNTRGH